MPPSITEADGVTIPHVLQWAGLPEPDAHGRFRCPTPDHADAHPSASATPSGRGWVCFGCGARRGILDLVVEVGATRDRAHAARWLEERTGLASPPAGLQRRGRPAQLTRRFVDAAVNAAPGPDLDLMHAGKPA